ncbi:MAG: hypothetical protein RL518_50 [Pseudomonadota bacterium]
MDNSDELHDDSWSIAYSIVNAHARIPQSLPHLIRACWNDLVTPTHFVRLLGSPGLPLRSLLRAANVPQSDETIKQPELTAAVDVLGVKASSLILAISSICEGTLDSGPATRIWSPLFKEMMSEIEIGYHLGSSLHQVGHEQGMLVGFSRLAGLVMLLVSNPKTFSTWYEKTKGVVEDSHSMTRTFGCEPYQVSSALMQYLGLGTEVALATASTLSDSDTTFVELKPTMQTWRATYHWLQALKNGKDSPDCEVARAAFAELQPIDGSPESLEHLSMLREQISQVRQGHSLWTWHLPYPTYEETAKAIVYRVNSNGSGTTWTKGLVHAGR